MDVLTRIDAPARSESLTSRDGNDAYGPPIETQKREEVCRMMKSPQTLEQRKKESEALAAAGVKFMAPHFKVATELYRDAIHGTRNTFSQEELKVIGIALGLALLVVGNVAVCEEIERGENTSRPRS